MQLRQIITKGLLPIIVGLFVSCTSQKVAYTPDIQNTYGFSEERLQSIQFYTSEDITLFINKSNQATRIANGKVIIDASDIEDAIFIPRNTPCVLVKKIDSNILVVSFESGQGKQISFINNGNTYSIGAKDWVGNQGVLKYGNKNYFTISKETFLMIKVRKLNHIIRSQRTIRGRRL
jgi:hypothetical protein